MCDPYMIEKKVEAPEERLARIVKADLGVTVSAAHLRLFIKANWSNISALAHLIHGKEDRHG